MRNFQTEHITTPMAFTKACTGEATRQNRAFMHFK